MFGKAYRLPFTLLGIPLLLDLSFLVVLPLLAWMIGQQAGRDLGLVGGDAFYLGLLCAVGLFVSVVIHELGHAVTARIYGVEVRNITLWFLGGIAQFAEMPRQRGAEAVVAIAGPIVSVVLALLCGAAIWLIPPTYSATLFVFGYLRLMNFMLAIFNLLPAMPLDGGRVLRSLLSLRMGHLRATQISAAIAKGLAVAMGITGLFFGGGIWLVLVAFFIYIAVTSETQNTLVVEMLQGIRVRDLMSREVKTVGSDMTVGDLMRKMVQEHHRGFPVMENGRMVGMVSLQNLQGADPAAPISTVFTAQVPVIPEHASALEAFGEMSHSSAGRLIVVDRAGQTVGIITRTDLMRAIQIRTLGMTRMQTAAGVDPQPAAPPIQP